MAILSSLTAEVVVALSQILTGKLLSEEQIRSISKSTVGSYFSDFLPTPKEDIEAKRRVEEAREHIEAASSIIGGLQNDLRKNASELDQVLQEIEEKKQLANHYSTLAQTNQELFSAFRAEIESSLRQQLRTEAERGKIVRQVVSAIIWLITLVLGAALGAYFIPLVEFIRNVISV